MSDYIKFDENVKVVVSLVYDQPLENTNQFGKKQYVYGIEPLPTGEQKFSATEKLHSKIQEQGLTKGDSFFITKVKDPDVNKGYAFFKIDLKDVPLKKKESASKPIQNDKGTTNFEKQFDSSETRMDMHELNLRLERMEKIVAVLWKDRSNKKEPENLNELPF
jgi:hypothetical protein